MFGSISREQKRRKRVNMISEGSAHSSQHGMARKRLTRQPGSREGATLWGFLFPFMASRLYPASDGWHAQVGLSTSISAFRKCPQ